MDDDDLGAPVPGEDDVLAAVLEALRDVNEQLQDLQGLVLEHSSRLQQVEEAVAAGVYETGAPADELRDWVDWLAATYALHDHLTGWEAMPGLERELHGLRRYHQVAHQPKAGATAETSWHEALARFIPRAIEYRSRRTKPQSCDLVSSTPSIESAHLPAQP